MDGRCQVVVAALAAILSSLPAGSILAQDRLDAAPADADGWHFVVAPYGWLTGVSGNMSIRGTSAPVDASIGDVVSDLNIAAMGQLEARKGDIGAFTNLVYASLEATNTAGPFLVGPADGVSVGPLAVDVSTDLFIADVAIFVRTVDYAINGGLDAGGSRLIIEPYAGARIWKLSGAIRIPVQDQVFKRTESQTWADAIVGFRSQWEITERWNATLIADIGGFVGGSTVTAQGTLLGGYRFGLFDARDANVVVGYKALYDDYSSGSGDDEFGIDLTMHGPVLGLAIQF